MKFKILADSTCDLSPELLNELDVDLARLSIIKDGQQYTDGTTITPPDIFAHVAAGGDLCSTAAYNVEEYISLFEKYTADYDAIIHINIGSGFSCSHQNARLAAEDFPNVRVVDSMNLSTGQGFIVLEACRLAKELDDVDEIVARLNDLIPRVETSFLLEQLQYMVKGGRCSATAALGANLLNLKPCIELKDGKLGVGKKYRGSYAKCLASYIKDRLDGRDDIIRDTLFFTHTPVKEDDLAAAMEAVNTYGHFNTVIDSTAGCTVSCHCGPGTLGVIFIHK